MQFISASEEHVPAINGLIARSKAYWDWPPEYLAAALPLLAVTSVYLRENLCFEIYDGKFLVGFLSLVDASDRRLLDHLWIEPARIGQGIGQIACDHVFNIADRNLWPDLTVLPDPQAEGFYARMGFRDTGERVRSRVPGGPVFHVFKKQFDSARP